MTPPASSPAADSAPLNGAQLIIRLLERQGVRLVAGIPGGALLPLYAALGESPQIRHVLARHEQAAGFIAQGMARITGRAGVCFATSGPGVTNIVTALADARLDSIPLVCIAGQVPTHLIGTDAFQEVATVAMTRPVTKAAFMVRSADELTERLPEAFHIAESGRPGPVLIDVPKDVQVQEVIAPVYRQTRPVPGNFPPAGDLYALAARMIDDAHRPVLYIGGGVVKARAERLLRELAERASLPVTSTLMALGAMPSDHPLSLGMLGMHGARYTNRVLEECDLAIAIGARFDDRATGRPDRFVPNARIVHIDVDAKELGKIRQPTLAIHADARHALLELLAHVSRRDRSDWLAEVSRIRTELPLRTPRIDEICSPYGIIRAVSECVPPDTIVTTDVGQHQMWVAQAYPFRRADRWLTSGGLGTMGFGLPSAIGAALADEDATVVCFTGDGSLLMNIQELATLAELDLNVKIVLFDNAALGLVRQQQELFYRRRFTASRFERASDFTVIARAFGIEAIDLGSSAEPRAALKQAMAKRGPVLVRVPIEAECHVLPMVSPGTANTEALDYE